MTTTITINGWPDYAAWAAAGYPGTKDCRYVEPRVLPDTTRGVCTLDGCNNASHGTWCAKHKQERASQWAAVSSGR